MARVSKRVARPGRLTRRRWRAGRSRQQCHGRGGSGVDSRSRPASHVSRDVQSNHRRERDKGNARACFFVWACCWLLITYMNTCTNEYSHACTLRAHIHTHVHTPKSPHTHIRTRAHTIMHARIQVRQWLALGVDPNIADFDDPDEGETPLMRAVAYGRSEVRSACTSSRTRICMRTRTRM